MATAIRLRGVSKYYGKARGIVDVDLDVEAGEVFGYLGPNGAGKTTTIRLLLDLIRPTSGSIEVLGESPADVALRHRVGYLPGDLSLYGDLTARQMLGFLDALRGGGSWGSAQSLAERLELDLERPISQLSKGNRQKVGLVQAFMHRPRLVILDEPTAGLDPLSQQAVYALIDESRAQGATVFLSSHVLAEVERITDRVGIIRAGRLVDVEELAALRAKALRRFEVIFANAVPRRAFAQIPNVDEVRIEDNVLTCRVTGSVDALIKAIGRYEVMSLVSQGADLEELFLSFYRGDHA